MALRAVTDHPKFFRLKLLLKLNKSCALGYLEALWHFCGKYTPQGNIGKYSDADIEAWLEWDGAEGSLVEAMAKAGWLDRDAAQRLIVHDWPQYADEIVHTDLARKCLTFADGTLPKTGRLNAKERERYFKAFPGASCGARPLRGESEAPGESGVDGQTESDTSQTKSDLGTKPEPEPAPAIPHSPPQGGAGRDGRVRAGVGGGAPRETNRSTEARGDAGTARDGLGGAGAAGGLSAEELEELAEVNRMRAKRHDPPLSVDDFAKTRAVAARIANAADPVPVRSRRRRWRG